MMSEIVAGIVSLGGEVCVLDRLMFGPLEMNRSQKWNGKAAVTVERLVRTDSSNSLRVRSIAASEDAVVLVQASCWLDAS
jgi:hypothetical protein